MSSEKYQQSAPCSSHGSAPGMSDSNDVYRIRVSINFLVRGGSESECLDAVMEHVQAPYACSKSAGTVERQVDMRNHNGKIAELAGGNLSLVAAPASETMFGD